MPEADPPPFLTRSIGSAEDLADAVLASIQQDPNVLGAADLYLMDYASGPVRVAAIAAATMGLSRSDGKRAIERYVVLVPAGSDADALRTMVQDNFAHALAHLTQSDLTPNEKTWIAARVSVISATDMRIATVEAFVARQPEDTMVLIMDAASYRDDAVAPIEPETEGGLLQPADVWVPQVHALAAKTTALVRERPLYLAIDAGVAHPSRQAHLDLLMSINGCGVFSGQAFQNHDLLIRSTQAWDELVKQGRIGEALQGVDALPPALERQKSALRIQILARAGHHQPALDALHARLTSEVAPDPALAVLFARIAYDAGSDCTALDLLSPLPGRLTDRDDLRRALDTTDLLDATALSDAFAERLHALFPGDAYLDTRRRSALARDGDFVALAALSGEALHAILARHLQGEGELDYAAMIDEGRDSGSKARLALSAADEAFRRGLPAAAFKVLNLVEPDASLRDAFDERFLAVLKAGLLSPQVALDIGDEALVGMLSRLVAALSDAPGRGKLRVGLAKALSPSVSGLDGLSLLVSLLLNLADQVATYDQSQMPESADLAWLQAHKPLLAAIFDWLAFQSPIVIGRTRAPRDLVTEPAVKIIAGVADFIRIVSLDDQSDVDAILKYLALGAAVAHYSEPATGDLRLLRLAGGKLASHGYAQTARDLAEQALVNGADTSARRRLAWFAVADVYHRVGNTVEALIALACVLVNKTPAAAEEAFQERVLLARTLRDLGMADLARRALDGARSVLKGLGLETPNALRIDLLDLQIRALELRDADPSSAPYQSLIDACADLARRAQESADDPAPVIAILSNVIRSAAGAGAPVSDEARAALGALIERIGGGRTTVLASERPAGDALLAVRVAGDTARYSDDAGSDASLLAILAERTLGDVDILDRRDDVALALEFKADLGVAMPGWGVTATPAPAPAALGDAADWARRLAAEGLNVVQAGWDDAGRLVRLETRTNRECPAVREMETLVSLPEYARWGRQFPFAYGMDPNPNLFHLSTEMLRWSSVPVGPTVVIADVRYQSFPPNLIRVGDDFAGRLGPIAAAPSLTWLSASRARGTVGDGRRLAWISEAQGENTTLPFLAASLAPDLEAHGFQIDTGSRVPSTFKGASMAVIAAHGGVHADGRYFQSIADEGRLRIAGDDLADALRNIDVVILFVCSAGRSDKHPTANTSLGLAKRILDRGCRAVVASPWPLSSIIVRRWFEAFAEAWDGGATVGDAVFAANMVIDNNGAGPRADSLALSVFGDPLILTAELVSSADE